METSTFIGLLVSGLIIQATSHRQNCPFEMKCLWDSQKMDEDLTCYLNHTSSLDYELLITPGQPGFEMWAESPVAQPFWDDFRRARIMQTTTELINHKRFRDRECNDLSPYTSCFSRYDTCYDSSCLECCENDRYRTLGGTCNNLQNPKLGAQYSAYGRMLPADYHDCIHLERRTFDDSIELPAPRIIGNKLTENCFGVQKPCLTEPLPNLVCGWMGQIITHDTGSRINVQRTNEFNPGILCCSQYYTRRMSEKISHPACKPMDIPRDDPFYSQFNASCLNFISSQVTFPNDCKLGPAQQSNTVSSFMDLTIIYGDDQATQNLLRKGQQKGRMMTNAADVLPETPNCTAQPCYFAGDARVVQTPMLSLLHSLFFRLHNLFAPLISTIDEIAYQECKRLITALYQRIMFNEWLPVILGEAESVKYLLNCNSTRTYCGKYNPNIDPSNTNDFTHGAFRFLHAAMPSIIDFYSYNGVEKKLLKSRPLSDMNSSQVNILDTQYDDLLRGLLFSRVSYEGYSPELRNKLMKDSKGMGVDLLSIDIKRGRDHGVRPYYAYIEAFVDPSCRINCWSDLSPYFTPDSLKTLQCIYKSPRDVDLFVGVLGEIRSTCNALLGKVGIAIILEQFKRFKFGDRFWYQWTDGCHPFNRAQLEEIENCTMAKLLCEITNIGFVPQNAFLTPSNTNPMVSCTTIPKFNIALFKK